MKINTSYIAAASEVAWAISKCTYCIVQGMRNKELTKGRTYS